MPHHSTASHERAYELMNNALELIQLFTIIERLVDGLPEKDQDFELRYIASQGARLSAQLRENLDRFSLDLYQSGKGTARDVMDGKGVVHG